MTHVPIGVNMRPLVWTKTGVTAVVLALASSACIAQSRVDPNADISLRGRVAHADGTAVPDRKVVLSVGPDVISAATVAFSLGLVCLAPEEDQICKDNRVTTTGADGSFGFAMKGSDTQGLLGEANTLQVTTRLDRKPDELEGPAVTRRFRVQTDGVELPLTAWEPEVAAEASAGRLHMSWSAPPIEALPPEAAGGFSVSAAFHRGNDELVWSQTLQPGTPLDLRLLEDSRGGFGLWAEALSVQVDDGAGDEIDVLLRSSLLEYQSPAGAPPSRARGCSVAAADGALVAQASCRLTDGDFGAEFAPRTRVCPDEADCAEGTHTAAVVDLGQSVDVSLVVVRGCETECGVETSPDGSTWRTFGVASDDEDAALLAAQPVASRYVRVRSPGGVDALTEVSVWDNRPLPEGIFLVRDRPVTSASDPRDPDGFPSVPEGPSRTGLLAVALALLLVAAAAGAVTATRRRST